MSTARRWTKWWWQDWQRDPALRMCSPAARGIWMDLLAIMFDAEPCGHLLVNGRQPTERQLAAVCGASLEELTSCLSELEEAGAFSRSEDGIIFNRRMVRDKAISDEASANGKMGGNPTLTGGLNPKRTTGVKRGVKTGVNPLCEDGLTTPLKHQEAEAEAYNPIVPLRDEPTLELETEDAKSGNETEGPARDFEAFWSAYPRKDGKASARKAYDRARRKIGHEAIMRAVSAWPFGENVRNGQDFRPHPASWLNGERWNDESVIHATAKPIASQYPPEVEAAHKAAKREWARTGCQGPPPMIQDFAEGARA